jgi:hypothetical protein
MSLKRVLILVGLLVAAVAFAACTPTKPPPPPKPTESVPLTYFNFIIEAEDKDQLPIQRRVGLTITAFDAQGHIATRKDPKTGVEIPLKVVLDSVDTPFTYRVELEPGVVNASLVVTFFGIRMGDRVKCHVEQNGIELPGTEAISAPVSPEAMMVLVTCLY